MREINANSEALKRNYLELTELKHILRKTQNFFDEVSRVTDPAGHWCVLIIDLLLRQLVSP